MKRKIKTLFLIVCSMVALNAFAQEIQIVRLNGKGNHKAIPKDSLKVYTTDLKTGITTPAQIEIIDVDESKLLYATVQEAYTATQKGGKATLVYVIGDKEDKIKGAKYIRSDAQEVRDIRSGKKKSNDIYVLARNKIDAKTTAYVYSISQGGKDVKVYVVKGGVEAWNKR